METNVLAGERGQYRLMQPAQAIQLPATVQVMPPARIDRLAQEDNASSRSPPSSAKMSRSRCSSRSPRLPHAALRRGLDHLPAAEFVYETGLFPDCASGAIWRAIAGMGMTEGVLGGGMRCEPDSLYKCASTRTPFSTCFAGTTTTSAPMRWNSRSILA